MAWTLSEEEQNGVIIAVNTILKRGWTSEGVELWWNRKRHDFDGRTPREVLPEDPSAVVDAAVDGMMMNAT